MAETMTPSITDEQIDKATDQLRAAMRKHREEIPKDVAQQALGVDNLGMRMFAVFRQVVEAMANMITRIVDVDNTVVTAMPKGKGGKTEVIFFKPRPEAYANGLITDDNLEKEFEFVGLKPADPCSLDQVNTDDPAFADTHPNGTHWKNAEGKWCFAAFRRWHGERIVDVREGGRDWSGVWWFAGVRK